MFSSAESDVYTVSSLNQSVASLLEQEFSWIWVEGEISNLAQPVSGHIYFSLKDKSAQVSCAMFKGRNRSLSFQPENGNQVLVRAKVSLYQPRGNYQLIVDRMEEAGDGALRRQFELLKQKLSEEGLFDEAHKREIPELPSNISIITSRSGAAIHDVLSVIERRFPSIPVKIFPVPVQGAEAAPAICNAIDLISENVSNGSFECDVILLVRGGGSLEDLWSFNEETVARAIYDCPVPIVSGVGHEVDITIADYVADVRAATPTAAAESITPDQTTWLQSFDWYQQRMTQLITDNIKHQKEKTQWLRHRLKQLHPENQIQNSKRQTNELAKRLFRSSQKTLDNCSTRLAMTNSTLQAHSPANLLSQNQQLTDHLRKRLQQASQNLLAKKQSQLGNVVTTLNAISPLKTLERGYSITLDKDGKSLISIEQVNRGDKITTRVQNGHILSQVEAVDTDC